MAMVNGGCPGCPGCTVCRGGNGELIGRIVWALFTGLLSEIFYLTARRCPLCRHRLRVHGYMGGLGHSVQQTVIVQQTPAATPAAPAAQAGPPPGWYADPHGGTASRWWDVAQWTEHLQGTQPPTPPAGT